MNLEMAREVATVYMRRGIPPYLHGGTGVGKSDLIGQIAEDDFDGNLVDLRVILLESVDLRGLPAITTDVKTEEKMVEWIFPKFLPNAKRHGKRGILFLDELSAAPQSLQAACYQLVLNKRVGEYYLPDGWVIAAAGNRAGIDKSVAYRLSAALGNRFGHIEVEPDVGVFIRHANRMEFHEMVVAFLRSPMGNDKLHILSENDAIPAFPTPRSWERVSDLLIHEQDLRPALRLASTAGLIGEGPARELEAFIQLYETLPDLDDVIARPRRAPVPDEPSQLFALSTALGRTADRSNFESVLTYAERMGKEYEMLIVRDAVERVKALADTSAFSRFVVANKDFRI